MQSQLVNEELEKKNIAVNLGGMTSSDEDVTDCRQSPRYKPGLFFCS